MGGFVGLLLLGFVSVVSSVHGYGYGYGGWTNAHATFYGGSDASGTMGMSLTLLNSYKCNLLVCNKSM